MSKRTVVSYRRKREGLTDYRKRYRLLSSALPRLVIRASNKHLTIQVVTYIAQGDKSTASASTKELIKKGWKASTGNVPAAYACGLLLAHKIKKTVPDCIVDTGLQSITKGGRIFAAVKGVKDGGVNVRAGSELFPDDARCTGAHLSQEKEGNSTIKQVIEKLRKEKSS